MSRKSFSVNLNEFKIFKKISSSTFGIVNVACIKSELSCRRLNLNSIQPAGEKKNAHESRLVLCTKKVVHHFGRRRRKNASDKFADAATFMRCQLEMNYYFVCTETLCTHSFKCIHEHVSITFI